MMKHVCNESCAIHVVFGERLTSPGALTQTSLVWWSYGVGQLRTFHGLKNPPWRWLKRSIAIHWIHWHQSSTPVELFCWLVSIDSMKIRDCVWWLLELYLTNNLLLTFVGIMDSKMPPAFFFKSVGRGTWSTKKKTTAIHTKVLFNHNAIWSSFNSFKTFFLIHWMECCTEIFEQDKYVYLYIQLYVYMHLTHFQPSITVLVENLYIHSYIINLHNHPLHNLPQILLGCSKEETRGWENHPQRFWNAWPPTRSRIRLLGMRFNMMKPVQL